MWLSPKVFVPTSEPSSRYLFSWLLLDVFPRAHCTIHSKNLYGGCHVHLQAGSTRLPSGNPDTHPRFEEYVHEYCHLRAHAAGYKNVAVAPRLESWYSVTFFIGLCRPNYHALCFGHLAG